MDQFEHEEQALTDAYERGEMTQDEHNRELDDLQRDYRAAAQEAAEDAYQRELGCW